MKIFLKFKLWSVLLERIITKSPSQCQQCQHNSGLKSARPSAVTSVSNRMHTDRFSRIPTCHSDGASESSTDNTTVTSQMNLF